MGRGLAGTVRGAQVCATCPHPRIRHATHGGPCSGINYITVPGTKCLPDTYRAALCGCARFTPRKGS